VPLYLLIVIPLSSARTVLSSYMIWFSSLTHWFGLAGTVAFTHSRRNSDHRQYGVGEVGGRHVVPVVLVDGDLYPEVQSGVRQAQLRHYRDPSGGRVGGGGPH
jgi:hypothetical protein